MTCFSFFGCLDQQPCFNPTLYNVLSCICVYILFIGRESWCTVFTTASYYMYVYGVYAFFLSISLTRADHNGKIFFPPLSFSIHPYNIFFSSFYCPIIFFFYFFSFCPRDIILLVRFFLHQQYPLSLPFIPVFIIFLVLSQNILLPLSVSQVISSFSCPIFSV